MTHFPPRSGSPGCSFFSEPARSLLGILLGILLIAPEVSSERFELCSATLALAVWVCWLPWQIHRRWRVWLSFVMGLVLGAGTTLWHNHRVVSSQETQIQLKHRLEAAPQVAQKGGQLQGIIVDREDRPDSVRLWLTQVIMPDLSWQTNDLVQITVYRKEVTALPGDRVTFRGKIFPLKAYQVPGSFDYKRYLINQGITATGYAKEPITGQETTTYYRINRLRQRISLWITHHVTPQNQGLVEALLVGKRQRISQEVNEALTVSGTLHLVAISGLHMGLVAGWSFFMVRLLLTFFPPLSLLHDNRRLAALLTLLPVVVYGSLAGWSISTQRAGLMVGLYLLAMALGRLGQGWRALIWAAMILLLCYPYELFQAGFQLSFTAVAGLLFLFSRMGKATGWLEKGGMFLSATLFMALVTLPVVLHHFHRLTPYGIIGNLLAVPWISLVSAPLGLLSLLVAPIHPAGAENILGLMEGSLSLFRQWVEWIAQWPGAWQRMAGPSLSGLGLWLILTAWSGMVRTMKGGLFLFGLALFGLFFPHPSPAPKGWLHVAALDVGQAQSVLLRTPQDTWSVIDAGGVVTPRFNSGEAVISAYLWHYGVQALERIIISHPQIDHMAGAQQLIRNFSVRELWVGSFRQQEEQNPHFRKLLEQAKKSKVAIHRFDHGTTQREGETSFHVFPPLMNKADGDLNDRSLVLLVTHGRHRFLFPGDVESAGEQWLLGQPSFSPVTLIMAPHHGSRSSSSRSFVEATSPQHVIFSVGLNNPYRFPHPLIAERWRESGAQLWRTDQQGTLVFQSDGLTLRTPLNSQPRILEQPANP